RALKAHTSARWSLGPCPNWASTSLARRARRSINTWTNGFEQSDHGVRRGLPDVFGARERLHWSFPGPSRGTGAEEEQLAIYPEVRDGIRGRIERELLAAPPQADMD